MSFSTVAANIDDVKQTLNATTQTILGALDNITVDVDPSTINSNTNTQVSNAQTAINNNTNTQAGNINSNTNTQVGNAQSAINSNTNTQVGNAQSAINSNSNTNTAAILDAIDNISIDVGNVDIDLSAINSNTNTAVSNAQSAINSNTNTQVGNAQTAINSNTNTQVGNAQSAILSAIASASTPPPPVLSIGVTDSVGLNNNGTGTAVPAGMVGLIVSWTGSSPLYVTAVANNIANAYFAVGGNSSTCIPYALPAGAYVYFYAPAGSGSLTYSFLIGAA